MSYKPRLLVIDDERLNRNILKRAFNDCDVVEAANSQEALLRLAQNPVDVILLDIMMPGISGLDLLHIIRRTHSLSELPIILISALDAHEIIANGILAGANDYITKPIEIDIVRARVQTQIHLKRYADERQLMINSLQSANTMKERIMQMASHDWKNPLQNLRLTHKIIRDKCKQVTGLDPYLEAVDISIKNMLNIIEQLLDTTVSSAHPLKLTPVEVDTIIGKVVQQYGVIAEQKSIRLDALPSGLFVQADAYRLTQILNNLVSNAIKYSSDNTRVTLYTEMHENTYYICVRDQGPGIPERERETLFEAFQRGSNQPTAGETSSGLGLWIVREMATQQKGEVGLECPPEGGSIFWVGLPSVPAAAGV